MKAVIQAVFPWKATGLDTCSGKKNDRIIHNSVPNSKQRRSPVRLKVSFAKANWYSIWRMTKGRYRKSIAAKKAPIATSTPNPDVVQPPRSSASTLLFACSHLDIDLASKESVLIYTT